MGTLRRLIRLLAACFIGGLSSTCLLTGSCLVLCCLVLCIDDWRIIILVFQHAVPKRKRLRVTTLAVSSHHQRPNSMSRLHWHSAHLISTLLGKIASALSFSIHAITPRLRVLESLSLAVCYLSSHAAAPTDTSAHHERLTAPAGLHKYAEPAGFLLFFLFFRCGTVAGSICLGGCRIRLTACMQHGAPLYSTPQHASARPRASDVVGASVVLPETSLCDADSLMASTNVTAAVLTRRRRLEGCASKARIACIVIERKPPSHDAHKNWTCHRH